jgi:phosphate-selective porin OprO/OprP
MKQPRAHAFAVTLLLLGASSGIASAQQAPSSAETGPPEDPIRRELEELRARQRWLEQRLVTAESRNGHKAEPAPAPPPVPPAALPGEGVPRFHFGRGGFAFGTADGKTELRVRAVLNVDGRAYVGTGPNTLIPDTFLIRRARPFIEGTLFDFVDFRLMPDFAYGQATILDAYVDLRPWRWLRLRGGRFMVPVGLEWMQKDTTIHFLERSLATDLVPYRDIGLMLFGDVADGTFAYSFTMGNGGADSGNGPDLDPESGKDYSGRIFIRPLRRVARAAAITDLGFGVGASYGTAKGTAAATGLATYKSTGQQTIFTYATASAGVPAAAAAVAVADGDRWRVTPQVYWYIGPVGILAEYVVSSQRVTRMDTSATLQHRAWNVTMSFVLTGERASFDGIAPHNPVDFHHRAFGAFELVARYSEIRFDDAAFPNYADPTVSVRSAREFAGGLNWHLTEWLKVMMSYHRTDFAGGSLTGDREAENALMGRLQLAL